MHVESSMVTPAVYAEAVLPRGVTTIVWDPHEFGNVKGLDGVRWAVEATRDLPLRRSFWRRHASLQRPVSSFPGQTSAAPRWSRC